MLPCDVLVKLSWDMEAALKDAKAVAQMAQGLGEDEDLAVVLTLIQETAATAQRLESELITLLLSVLPPGVKSNHQYPSACGRPMPGGRRSLREREQIRASLPTPGGIEIG
jgi:hypothetical protein